MSLIRQVWLLLLSALAMAFMGSVAALVITSRDSMQTHLAMRNGDAAQMLALAMSQQKGDPELMRLVASAQFDTGHYQAIRLLGAQGEVLFQRSGASAEGHAPGWFRQWLPMKAMPGLALVSDGWRSVGRLEVSAQADWAVDALWAGCVRAFGFLLALGALLALMAVLTVRRWRKPLEATVAQAQALEEGRFVMADEPSMPELRALTRSMNSLVKRLKGILETQAEHVHSLRVQADSDPLTGLSQRRQFMAQVANALYAGGNRGAVLLILRLRAMHQLNRDIGHEATDRLLQTMANVLQAYPQRVSGALCGRLNGSDFGLFLPASGLAKETASSLAEGLRAALTAQSPQAQVVIGGVDPLHEATVATALAAADAALARAESLGAYMVDVEPPPEEPDALRGEHAWRAALVGAIDGGRVQLKPHAVVGRDGQLLRVESSLQVQLLPSGPYEPPQAWLWMALRVRLTARLDLVSMGMALQAVYKDWVPRCVHVAGASLGTTGFINEVAGALEAMPEAAKKLSIEVKECVAEEHTDRVGEAARRWRGHGVQLGLEHAGAALKRLPHLHEMGVDYIKVDERYIHSIAVDAAVREFARSLVALAHGMDVKVVAAGVDNAADLEAIWTLGFDAATGPQVALPPPKPNSEEPKD